MYILFDYSMQGYTYSVMPTSLLSLLIVTELKESFHVWMVNLVILTKTYVMENLSVLIIVMKWDVSSHCLTLLTH